MMDFDKWWEDEMIYLFDFASDNECAFEKVSEYIEKLKAENESLRECLKLTTFSLKDCIYELKEACLDLDYSTDIERLYSAEKLLKQLETN